MDEKKFLDEVLAHIPRATGREKRDIRSELAGHLADHALDLEEQGCSTEEAREQAVAAMGDPGEIGEALNAQLSTFWFKVQVLAQAAVAILLVLMLGQLDWQDQIRLIRENKMARQGPVAWATYGEDACLRWDSGEEMQAGDSIVRLEGGEVRLELFWRPDTPTGLGWARNVGTVEIPKLDWMKKEDLVFFKRQFSIPTPGGNGATTGELTARYTLLDWEEKELETWENVVEWDSSWQEYYF